MELLNLILGILGLVLSAVSLYMAYVTFINPVTRFNWYLEKADGWEKFLGTEAHIYFYRYKKYPNFQISIDWDKVVVENFFDDWMGGIFIADKENNQSHFLKLEANGMLLDKELFVSIDGHRSFVPVPRTMVVGGEIQFYYDSRQIYLAKILGHYHFEKDIFEFTKNAGILINMTL